MSDIYSVFIDVKQMLENDQNQVKNMFNVTTAGIDMTVEDLQAIRATMMSDAVFNIGWILEIDKRIRALKLQPIMPSIADESTEEDIVIDTSLLEES